MITTGNFKQDESILILPHNTLRYVDVIKELDIRKMLNIPQLDFDVQLFETVTRKSKDIESLYNLDDEQKLIVNSKWLNYYELAPKTNFYKYLDIIIHQKFIKKTIVLFDQKKEDGSNIEPDFENFYYDGSIEELENIINQNNITCLIIDDIDLLKTLSDRENVDLNNKSIIISKTGYNMIPDENLKLLVTKPELEMVNKKYSIEPSLMRLFDFDETVYDKVRKYRNSINEIIRNGKEHINE